MNTAVLLRHWRAILMILTIAGVAVLATTAVATATSHTTEVGPAAGAASIPPGHVYVPLSPTRILDSRNSSDGDISAPIGTGQTASTTVVGVGGVPADASAVVVNATAVNATTGTFVTVYPSGQARPWAATFNPRKGGVISNEVIATVGDGGKVDIYNLKGSVDVIFDIVGYFQPDDDSALEARLDALETAVGTLQSTVTTQDSEISALQSTVTSQDTEISALRGDVSDLQGEVTGLQSTVTTQGTAISALQTLLDGAERNGDTLRLSGMNLQVANGTGTTHGTPNGLGNLIIGYNTTRPSAPDKSGSHYLVIGDHHNYTSSGGIVAGWSNTATGLRASVFGGTLNTAGGQYASVLGGTSNTAGGTGTSVSGGFNNVASGNAASVSGGYGNIATSATASVSGGSNNTASGLRASVSGGSNNTASGDYASISGGYNSTASNNHASVTGGYQNAAEGWYSSVSGGFRNTAEGSDSSILGGDTKTTTGSKACHPTC